MIDITNIILTRLRDELDGVLVVSNYQSNAPKFPIVTVEELSNSVYTRTRDSGGNHHSSIGYMIDIYTKGNGRVSQSKRIRNEIDKLISEEFGLIRVSTNVVPNFLDESIYRYRINYDGVISNDMIIYRG